MKSIADSSANLKPLKWTWERTYDN